MEDRLKARMEEIEKTLNSALQAAEDKIRDLQRQIAELKQENLELRNAMKVPEKPVADKTRVFGTSSQFRRAVEGLEN